MFKVATAGLTPHTSVRRIAALRLSSPIYPVLELSSVPISGFDFGVNVYLCQYMSALLIYYCHRELNLGRGRVKII